MAGMAATGFPSRATSAAAEPRARITEQVGRLAVEQLGLTERCTRSLSTITSPKLYHLEKFARVVPLPLQCGMLLAWAELTQAVGRQCCDWAVVSRDVDSIRAT